MIQNMSWNHKKIEKKWQERWEQAQLFKADRKHNRPKFYALNMFPYPSGAGLHIGHLASYTPTEVVARFKRAKGFNVLHPIGWDAFGLPAEQYAIQTGSKPEEQIQKSIQNFKRQLKSFGYSFNWEREISTCDPSYYKWTQYIFKILYKKGLAYQAEAYVNWCPALRTVLANEEVIDGQSERGGHEVLRVLKKQWMLKITAYCEKLIKDLDDVDWPERTKTAQKNWIGKSQGALIRFPLKGCEEALSVWTTRPDTLFGVSYMVLAPEHPLIAKITTEGQKAEVKAYQKAVRAKSERDRKAGREKTGAFTGGYARHPATGEDLPVWVSDYVLMGYGSGAVMAVPAHDERDYEFASHFHLKILPVVESAALPFMGDGPHIHSNKGGLDLNGLRNRQAFEKSLLWLEKTGFGKRQTQYKLRDWLFSRQRYWGEPFPIVKDRRGQTKAVPDKELPVLLPSVADYKPSEKGEPPLARVPEFVNYKGAQQRETDTMPGSAASSWYFLRYTDPHNHSVPFDFEEQKYWMPVDLYVGGSEHSVGHLLYSRFWQKLLFDEGLVSHKEPFKKLAHQGTVLGADGFRMSKSRGNGVNPDELRERYGADTLRLYICFLGPFDKDKPWSPHGIEGARRFLDRFFRFAVESAERKDDLKPPLRSLLNQTIKKVTEDIEAMSFNTAVSALMILLNEIYKSGFRGAEPACVFCRLLMPFAPHIAEEAWEILGKEGFVSIAPWPDYDHSCIREDEVSIGVQVNGKLKASLLLAPDESEEAVLKKALQLKAVSKSLAGRKLKKHIYKPGKILSLVVV